MNFNKDEKKNRMKQRNSKRNQFISRLRVYHLDRCLTDLDDEKGK